MPRGTTHRKTRATGDFLSRFALEGAKPQTFYEPGVGPSKHGFIDFVLDALNGRHSEKVAEYLGFHLTFHTTAQTPEFDRFLEFLRENPECFYSAVDHFAETVRQMADMWIASGKDRMNPLLDSPRDRNVEEVQLGQPISLFAWIDRLVFDVNPSYTGMRRDGTIGIKRLFPRFDLQSLRWGKWEESMKGFARMYAAYTFTNFLDSAYSLRLSRCDSCKTYFVYVRARLRVVKNGVHCGDCGGAASVGRTTASRAKRLDTAARAWIEWDQKPRRIGRPEWVAEQVNRTHGTSFGRRWVSQHQTEILARVEALRNAQRQG